MGFWNVKQYTPMNPYKNHVNTGREKTIFCFLESQPTKTYALSEPVLFTTVKYFPPIITAAKKTIFFFDVLLSSTSHENLPFM